MSGMEFPWWLKVLLAPYILWKWFTRLFKK